MGIINERYILPNMKKSIGRQCLEAGILKAFKDIFLDWKYIHFQGEIDKEKQKPHPNKKLIKFYTKCRNWGEK